MQSPVSESETLSWTDLVSIQKKHPGVTFPRLRKMSINVNERVTPTMDAPLLERIECEFPGAMVTTAWLCERVATHHPHLSFIQLNTPDSTSNALMPYTTTSSYGERGISLEQLKALPHHIGGLSLYIHNTEAIETTLTWLEYCYGDVAFDSKALSKRRRASQWGYLISDCYSSGDHVEYPNTSHAFSWNRQLGMTWISAILFKFAGLFSTVSVNMIGTLLESPELDDEYFSPIVRDIQSHRTQTLERLNTRLILAMEGDSEQLKSKLECVLDQMKPEEIDACDLQWAYPDEESSTMRQYHTLF